MYIKLSYAYRYGELIIFIINLDVISIFKVFNIFNYVFLLIILLPETNKFIF